jgi:hypothetical protein
VFLAFSVWLTETVVLVAASAQAVQTFLTFQVKDQLIKIEAMKNGAEEESSTYS